MPSTDTKSQFIELRAKNWSLARIATQLKVAPRTLVEWNRQSQAVRAEIRKTRLEPELDEAVPPPAATTPSP